MVRIPLAWDGKIAMTELARLVGSTHFRTQPLELLTLSACETAAGDDPAAPEPLRQAMLRDAGLAPAPAGP